MTHGWFMVRVGIRPSQQAHAFATTWTRREDGLPESACGVRPYDHGTDVAFIAAADEDPRCPDCAAKLELIAAAEAVQPEPVPEPRKRPKAAAKPAPDPVGPKAAKTALCERCGKRPISKKAYSCRPCAVAHGRGREPYDGPCSTPTRDAVWHLNKLCAECGYPLPDHEYADVA